MSSDTIEVLGSWSKRPTCNKLRLTGEGRDGAGLQAWKVGGAELSIVSRLG